MKSFRYALFVLLVAALGATQLVAQPDSGYKVNRRIPLGGDGGWDYLKFDAASQRLFVARATRVMVVDLASGKLAGEIPNTLGVHGVALVPELGRGVTSNGKEDSATVFDLKTLAPIAKVKTGGKPDAILFDPFSGLVLTFNGKSNTVTLIDAAKAQAVGSIDLPGRPETGVSDGKGKVFVNLEDKNQLAVIDVAARKVLGTWALPGCEEPTGLAFDAANRRLFSACHSGVLVVTDAVSGRNVAQVAIGAGVDAADYDEPAKLVFTSNGEGSISVIRQESADKYTALARVATQKGAKTMALDPETHTVYTVALGVPDVSGKPGPFELLVVSPGK
ncbi:MAG: YncE family protein [Acidobacteriota bacterium]|nr:YncE family protein [Acidobacteriota bacterium]